jgi:outer membrane protein assembly factor BamB
VGLDEPGPKLTRRHALTGLGGLGAASLLVTGCAAGDPVGHALTTAATRRAVHPPGTLLWHVRTQGIASLVVADSLLCAGVKAGVYAMHAGTGQKAWTRYGDTPVTPYAAERGVLFGDSLAGVEAGRLTVAALAGRAYG